MISDVSKIFDVFGWFAPCTVKMKILFQKLWTIRIGWDDPVPEDLLKLWSRWRTELHLLSTKTIHRCMFDRTAQVSSMELHGTCISVASELAYAAVIYLHIETANGNVQISLISSKTKVAPMKRITIPHLELCGAHLVQLIHNVQLTLSIPLLLTTVWTDSTIVLSWMERSPPISEDVCWKQNHEHYRVDWRRLLKACEWCRQSG